jgi:Peptidase A4 family
MATRPFVRAAGVLILAVIGATSLGCQAGSGGPGSPSASTSSAPGDSAAAVKAVVQHANQEQQQAFDQDKPTLMRDTATATYYAELVRADTTLRNNGVTAIQLRSATFGPVVVQGNGAQATTTETWRATFANGPAEVETGLNIYKLVQSGGAWRIASDTVPNTNAPPPGTSPSAAPTPTANPGSASGTVGSTSRNWAGYVASGIGFTSARGTWTIPNVSASGGGVDATWVGIGGATTTDLIQAGTQGVVDNGVVQYSAWIETLPQASQTVALTVNPGDSITVSITQQSSNAWNVGIQNATNGGTYTGTVSYTSSDSSAEWIEEAPTSGRGVVKLDQFGTVQFSNASAVKSQQPVSAGQAGATPVTMINSSGVKLAVPSALAGGGSTFSVTRT